VSLGKEITLNTLTENVEVQGIDGKKHQVRIRALGEGEIIEALGENGLEFSDFGNPEKFAAAMKFLHTVCVKSIGEDLAKVLLFGEAAKLSAKILEISGIRPETLSAIRVGQKAIV